MTPMLTPYGMPAGVKPHIWRQSVEARIQGLLDAADRLIDALDRMDPDPDLEPDNDDEPGTWPQAEISRVFDKGTDENLELGGDDEPELGWGNSLGQSGVGLEGWVTPDPSDTNGGLYFTGEGHVEAERLLREKDIVAGPPAA